MWYHTCPSKGKGCNRTDLVEHKGCCIWQEEVTLLKAIETRLGGAQAISTLDGDNLLAGYEQMAAKYGLHKDEAGSRYVGG